MIALSENFFGAIFERSEVRSKFGAANERFHRHFGFSSGTEGIRNMVQEFMILKCFSCATFQVHQVKKSKKWVCKVCGEKQSIKKVYAQGTGLDCRKHVQKLNMKQGEVQEAKDLACNNDDPSFCDFIENTPLAGNFEASQASNCNNQDGFSKGGSKWEKFLEISSTDNEGLEDLDDNNITTERAFFDKALSRRKRKSSWLHSDCKTGTSFRGKGLKKNARGDSVSRCSGLKASLPNTPLQELTSKQVDEFQSFGKQAQAHEDLESNTQNNPYKCNIYFAKATRDPSPVTKKMNSSFLVEHERRAVCSSKWNRFMSSSSSQTDLHETCTENNPFSLEPYRNNCQEDSEIHHSQGSSFMKSATDINAADDQCCSQLVQNLFKVDDELDDHWWNSL